MTHDNFIAKAVRKFYFDRSDKLNDDAQFRAAHSLATCCLANIDKLRNSSIFQSKQARAAGAGTKQKVLEVW